MTLKNVLVALAAGIALALPSAARAYEYNDGTYIWGFYTYVNDNNERVASLSEVCRVDEQKIEGAITFPATVSLTVTNELGYLEQDETTDKYNWVSTRPQKVVTLTLPVEEIGWWGDGFKNGPVHEYAWGTSRDTQYDPLITSITIPEGVKYVYGLVGECLTNVTAVTFPSTVKSITSCFGYCDKLASVSVPEDAYIDSAFIGTPWAQAMGDFFIWNGNLIRYQGTATEVVVPEGVETLGTAAFAPYYWGGWTEESWEMFASAINITSVTLPASLEEIGDAAFNGCEKLASLNIPDRVYSIGWDVFGGCAALTAITLPQKMVYLGEHAFSGSAISSLKIPDGVTDLWMVCDDMTNLTSVTLSETVKYIDHTFTYCDKLAAIDLPASVEQVGSYSFDGCKSLTRVTGGAGLKYVDSQAFGYDGEYWDEEKQDWVKGTGVPYYDNAPAGIRALGPVAYGYKGDLPENLVIPGNIKYVMPDWTDYNNEEDVKTLTLSDGVEVLGFADPYDRVKGAFDGYVNLETVNLGNTVTNLFYAFLHDAKLATVTGGAALESGLNAFSGTKYQQNLAALAGNDEPFELIRLGKVVLGYKGKFAAGAFAIPDDVTEFFIDGWEDESTKNVTALTGGAALTGIDCCIAFEKLQRIELTGALRSFWCSNPEVTDINLPNAKLQWVDHDAFLHCTNLVNVTMGVDPDGLREAMMNDEMIYGEERGISSMAFMQCDKLQSVNVICKGYKMTGFETWFESGKETFANELSTFKYGNERVDFSAPDEHGVVVSEQFYLIPMLVKAPAGSYLVVFQSEGETSYEQAFACNRVDALPSPRFTGPEGKTFKGWAGSNGKRYDDGVLIFNAAAEGEVLTLTAIWGE